MSASGPDPSASQARTARFGLLAIMLSSVIFLQPLVARSGLGDVLLEIGMTAVLASAAFAASGRRWVLWFTLGFGLPTIALGWSREVSTDLTLYGLHLISAAVFLGLIFVLIVSGVLRRRRVDAQIILGGICGYLLLVMIFALLHGVIEIAAPGSYTAGGQALQIWAPDTDERFAEILYFSVITITTLGYGDIAPVGDAARSLSAAEAMFGQLYLAVLIARLVGLHTAQGHAQWVMEQGRPVREGGNDAAGPGPGRPRADESTATSARPAGR